MLLNGPEVPQNKYTVEWLAPVIGRPTDSGRSKMSQHSLGHHHLDKLLVINLTITVNICLTDHLVDLLIRELLPKVGHHVPQLRSADETISVTVKNLEGLDKLFLGVGVLHLPCHEGQELGEIDGAVSVSIHLIDHILQLGLSR